MFLLDHRPATLTLVMFSASTASRPSSATPALSFSLAAPLTGGSCRESTDAAWLEIMGPHCWTVMQLRPRALAGYLPPIRFRSVWEWPLGSAGKQRVLPGKTVGGGQGAGLSVVAVDGLLELPWNWLGPVEDFKERLVKKRAAPWEPDLCLSRKSSVLQKTQRPLMATPSKQNPFDQLLVLRSLTMELSHWRRRRRGALYFDEHFTRRVLNLNHMQDDFRGRGKSL